MNQIFVFDTTLRDGTQMEGFSLSPLDKLAVAKRLDNFGVHYIEGGWPGSNPRDREFFELATKEVFQNALLMAFCATHHKKFTPEEDPNLKATRESGAAVLDGARKTQKERGGLSTGLQGGGRPATPQIFPTAAFLQGGP